jgi:hypothetical protein
MPAPVEERTKSGTKAFQIPSISLVILPEVQKEYV